MLVGATITPDQIELAAQAKWIREPARVLVGKEGSVPSGLQHRYVTHTHAHTRTWTRERERARRRSARMCASICPALKRREDGEMCVCVCVCVYT